MLAHGMSPIYSKGYHAGGITSIGAAVMVVFDAAREQDPVALDAIRWLGCELGDLAIGVIRQLHFENSRLIWC